MQFLQAPEDGRGQQQGVDTVADAAVAVGRADIGDASRVAHVDRRLARRVLRAVEMQVADAVERVQLPISPLPVVAVGGGEEGFDVDVAKLVAAKLGVKPEFVTTEWSGILAGLAAGKYDVIVNQVGVTEKRQEAFDFSDPYTISSPQLIVNKSDKRVFKSLEDLKGKKLGVGQGSNFEQKAKSVPGIDVRTYPGSPEYLADLAAGRIDAALNDSLLVGYILKSTQLPLKGGNPIGTVDKIGIPFRKDNPEFKAALNKALADIKADGSFKQASEKWFGIDVSQPPKAQ